MSEVRLIYFKGGNFQRFLSIVCRNMSAYLHRDLVYLEFLIVEGGAGRGPHLNYMLFVAFLTNLCTCLT